MYDNHHEDWPRMDAEQVLAHGGCGHCPHPTTCQIEGVCVEHLEPATPQGNSREDAGA